MENRNISLRQRPPRHMHLTDSEHQQLFYEIGIGIIVPTLASAHSCSTPDLAIVVSSWGGLSCPAHTKLARIYTASFAGPNKHRFVMHHELSTLLHNKYTLRGTRVLVGVYPLAYVQEKDTPRQILHEFLMKRFNDRGVFHYSSMWSNSSWVFTVLEYIRHPDVFWEYPNKFGIVPRPIDVLEGHQAKQYNIISVTALEERLLAVWRRSYRIYKIYQGPVRLRKLDDYTPRQIAPGRFGVPVKPRRLHQHYHPYHQHQHHPQLHQRGTSGTSQLVYDSDPNHSNLKVVNRSWAT